MKLALFCLLTFTASAACTHVGSTWPCPSTGNANADGLDFWTHLNNQDFGLDETVILDAADYNTPLLGGSYFGFRFKARSCTPGHRTQIISANLSSLPASGTRLSFSDRTNMAHLVASGAPTGDGPGVLSFNYGGATCGWVFRGVMITSASTCTATITAGNFDPFTAVGSVQDITGATRLSDLESDIEFDRFMVIPYEEAAYGNQHNATTQAAFFRCFNVGMNLQGQNIYVHDGIIGVATYIIKNSPTVNISTCTNANPMVCTSTGIAASFSLSSGITGCNLGPTTNCYDGAGSRIAVFQGATGSWTPLNGAKRIVYESANSIRVYLGTLTAQFSDARIDTTGFGAFTGTVTAKLGIPHDPVYEIQMSSACVNCRVINNLLEHGAMTFFTGGGNFQPTDYRGVIQTGSSSTHLILDTITGLSIGQLIMAQAPGISSYCFSPGAGCQVGGTRVGQVTAIDTMTKTATIIPYGVTGFDVSPTIGGYARWNGRLIEQLQLRRNTFLRHNDFPFNGKGYIELKNCKDCLIDGNIFTDTPIGNVFCEAVSQADNDPWNRCENLIFSNNLFGGLYGHQGRMTLFGQHSEESNTQSSYTYFDNNLLAGLWAETQAWSSPTDTFGIYENGGGFLNAGWKHNTTIGLITGDSIKAFLAGGCNEQTPLTPPVGDYFYSTNMVMKDNLMSYGNGLAQTVCLNAQASNINHNVFLADGSVNAASIIATWPGNSAQDLLASIKLVGLCNFATYENCALDPTSPYRGTASDSKDPGADIPQLKDRINGWSENAGLLTPDISITPAAMVITFTPGSNAASPIFTVFNGTTGATCKFFLYTDPIRTVEHVSTAGSNSCNRMGNTVVGAQVTFNLNGLASGTTFYYKLLDGSRTMVAEFTTSGSLVRPTITTSCAATPFPSGTQGVFYSENLDASGSTPFTWTTGTLPAGLTLVGATIQGTPTTPGTSNFNIDVSNAAGASLNGPLACSIQINSAAAPTFGRSQTGTRTSSGSRTRHP